MENWDYEPAADLELSLRDRLKGFPREPHLWMYILRILAALLQRMWFKLYHRLEIHGADKLPIGQSFVMVANHQSHLDAPSLVAAIPLRWIHRAFPAAAADYFFKSAPRSAFSSIVINALPFERHTKGGKSLAVCRELLQTRGNILIIFPEGTRGENDDVSRFRSGIGRLVEGTGIPVVPCNLQGAAKAFPKGAYFSRPFKLILHIGEPHNYGSMSLGWDTVEHIGNDLRKAVANLGKNNS
jgi:1-acyl-sn-glycerol-3-phosphate acyltransferase